jgi:hypothetical protein
MRKIGAELNNLLKDTLFLNASHFSPNTDFFVDVRTKSVLVNVFRSSSRT